MWALRDPRMTSLVIGASSVKQLEDNIAALRNMSLTADELAEIDQHATDAGINLWKQLQRSVSAVSDAERRRGRRCSAMGTRWPGELHDNALTPCLLDPDGDGELHRDVQPESWLDRLRYRGSDHLSTARSGDGGEWPPCRSSRRSEPAEELRNSSSPTILSRVRRATSGAEQIRRGAWPCRWRRTSHSDPCRVGAATPA